MSTVNYLQSWTDKQTKAVEKVILSFLKSRNFFSRKSNNMPLFSFCKTFTHCDNLIGFAYTSSSECAGLWVCNDEIYIDVKKQYIIKGFIMDAQNIVYVYCTDTNENELIIPIN